MVTKFAPEVHLTWMHQLTDSFPSLTYFPEATSKNQILGQLWWHES